VGLSNLSSVFSSTESWSLCGLSSNHPLLELAELELAAFNILVTYSSSIHPFYVFLYIPHSFSLHAIPYFQNTKTNTPITSGPRSHPNVSPQISLPIPSYAPSHTASFYTPNSYNASPIYYPPQSSVPLTQVAR